jgi:glycosyltransferase involved in cell wall biosynthesis
VGCAVVSSSGGSLAEVVGDAGLLVLPGDEQALSEAVARAWQNDALREELGRRGKERAGLFTWQQTAERTRKLYSEALSSARKKGRQ